MIGWSQNLIAAEKARIKGELDGKTDPALPHSRLRAALAEIVKRESDDSDLGRLQRYIYAMSALVQHERAGGLSTKEVSDLVTLAYAILQAQGVRPRASRLASLYGDVHLVRSQIFRKEGKPWRAAWEQQVALQLAGDFPSGGLGFQLLGMANRALRLGHARLATEQLVEAEAAGLPESHLPRCRLARVQALWLSSRGAEAAELAQATMALAMPDDLRREFEWIELCGAAQTSSNFQPLLNATRRGAPFYDGTYVIEACLWAMAVETREHLDRLPSLESLRRSKQVRPQRLGPWYECGLVLQECYDHAIPLPFRLRSLARILELRPELLTVDKELLLLAAAVRCLARSKSHSLAVLVFCEYRALSQRLTDGKSIDALGVLGDLMERPWLQKLAN